METATQGRSLGRWALGSRIVRDDGGAVAFRHAFIRSFVGLFEVVLTFGGVAVTVARYRTPNGDYINKVGVKADRPTECPSSLEAVKCIEKTLS